VLAGVGVLLAGFGLRGFLLPSQFIDGGATGIALMLTEVWGWPFAPALLLVNAPFVAAGARAFGLGFLARAGFAIGALALVVTFVPFPVVTQDKLLVAAFGGILLGTGIGLAMRGGGVLDGTEALAVSLSQRFRASVGDVITVINVAIFALAAWLISLESAMYSLLAYVAASKAVDYVVNGIEEYTAVLIVSQESDALSHAITRELGHGVTVLAARSGHGTRGARESDVLYTVVTRLEVPALSRAIEAIDPHAFVTMHGIRDLRGGIVRKRPGLHQAANAPRRRAVRPTAG